MREDVTNLTNEVNKLSEVVERQQPYSRCNCLLFHGILGLFREEISACAAVHARCYGHVRSCVIHNSFASYDGGAIRACCANKAHCQ